MYVLYIPTYHLWYLVGISMEKSCGACSVYSCCMHARTWYIHRGEQDTSRTVFQAGIPLLDHYVRVYRPAYSAGNASRAQDNDASL